MVIFHSYVSLPEGNGYFLWLINGMMASFCQISDTVLLQGIHSSQRLGDHPFVPQVSPIRLVSLYSYGHLSVITDYKWDYTFYKWGFVSTYTWYFGP